MKNPFRSVLALAALVAVAALPLTAHAYPPTGASTNNGAYVVMGKPPNGGLQFKYGWNTTSQFVAPASGYWLGLYDVTNSYYVWVTEIAFPAIGPGTNVVDSVEYLYNHATASLPPGDYSINFFVRKDPSSNVAVIEHKFTVK
jgi:hypothetical protein